MELNISAGILGKQPVGDKWMEVEVKGRAKSLNVRDGSAERF